MEGFPYEDNERMNQPGFTVTRIAEGLGFGSGTITGEADQRLLDIVDNAIHNNPDILVPVDRDDDGELLKDDGCGDGRGVVLVFTKDAEYKRSLNRSKVFGGGVVQTAAIAIGTGVAHDAELTDLFDASIEDLNESDLDYGAHTDEHAHGEKCGCGAIDRFPEGLMAAVKHETEIRQVIAILGVDATQIDTVFENFRAYVSGPLARSKDYSGKAIMNKIIAQAKVVKQLGDDHKERRIVLNQVREHTVNQGLIRDITDNEAQIFAVDVWRLDDIATEIASDTPEVRAQAFLSELVYTLGIAAVLTKGDLPVDVIQAKEGAAS